jgi:tripartite-type tricarboxylate transporter receptor subunit TctC
LLAPAATPRAIIDKLSTEIARILAMPSIREQLVSQGMVPFVSTPDQFATLIRSDLGKYTKIIRTANIKLEQ